MSNLTTKALSRWIMVGGLLATTACSPVSHAADRGPDTNAVDAQENRVLAFGLDAIKERYLTDVVVANVAMNGMHGLATVDPAISVERDSARHVLVRYRNQQVADYAAPDDDDAQAWAKLIVRMTDDAAVVSPNLRQAGAEKIYEAFFDAALAKLDFFSRYAGKVEAIEHRAARNGFGGVGIRYEPHPEDIVLTEVLPNTPAAKGNLQVGDHVNAIDGASVAGLDHDEISRRLRGPIASRVVLTVKHKDAQQVSAVTLLRGLIVPRTVSVTMKDGIATIAISSFNQSTAEEATEAVEKAKATPGFKGVVLDLRGNPGGLLDQGVGVADLFMDHGRIVSTRGRNPASVQLYDAKPGDPGEDVPLVVLVDGGSASAAEIVTAALQDSGRAVVVGTNSYGKGTVQTVIRMPNDGEMTLTWSRFYSPTGYALHGLGVLPALCTADTQLKPVAVMAELRDGHLPLTASMAAWRASTVDEVDERKHLRSACPAAKHANMAVDLDLARQLILDHNLYMQALTLTKPVTTASSAAAVPVSQP